jgi:predicted amidohydrolase/ribosomal protein S18 acetylase RimI-like enzyme
MSAHNKLKDFEKRIIIRPLIIDDFNSIVKLQLKCFPGMKPWSEGQFSSQLKTFQEGQIAIEYNGIIVASSSSLIVDFSQYSNWQDWHNISDNGYITNHNIEGNVLYGIEIMVSPDYRGMKLARRLYDARKDIAKKYNLEKIIIGGRIPGYYKHSKKMNVNHYVEKVISKELYDPVLTTQISNGFALKELIPNYLPNDRESLGYATFLEWTNLEYVPEPKQQLSVKTIIRACVIQYQMRKLKSFNDFASYCEYFIDVASDYKCDFILFPELFTTQLLSIVKNVRPGLAARELAKFTSKYLELFSTLSIKYNINIIGGSHLTLENENLYNISYLFHRNGKINKQYKIHITPNEKRWWGVTPGNSVEVFDTDCGKISILICYDIEFPELARIAVKKGAQVIFVPFCTDERYAYLRVRYCSQARCIENQVYVAISGSVGNLPSVENMDIQYSQSAIFTPSDIPFSRDAIAAECTPNIEMLIFEDLDFSLLKGVRHSGSVLNLKDRRSDIYKLLHFENGEFTEV